MGWKNLKTHFEIKHIVQVGEGKIKIGSGYLPEMITIDLVNPEDIQKNSIVTKDSGFFPLWEKLTKELALVKQLVETPDTFKISNPVFTFECGEVLEKRCEDFGYPNVTHDGLVMYENAFSKNRAEVVEWAVSNAKSSVEYAKRSVERDLSELERSKEHLAVCEGWLKKANELPACV
jgi:hypothetical protein